jgi:sigma-B regulation protein RsbU (phosphoserine phosphatase)
VLQRLERVNREVLMRCKGKATMTMTAVVIDQNTGDVVLYGIGGLPALLMVPDGRHVILSARGTPLGSSPRLEVGEKTARLGPGDRLVITTDGIIETAMANGRPFGFRRFVNEIVEVRAMPLEQAVERIVRDVDLARSNRPQEDDFTFCVLERHG